MARVGFGDDIGGEGTDGRNSDVVGGVGGESCHGSEVVTRRRAGGEQDLRGSINIPTMR